MVDELLARYFIDISCLLSVLLHKMEKAEIATRKDQKSNVVKDDTPNAVSRKRKADSESETSPSKTTKPITDDFCLYVGNLNNSKTSQEIKDSLAVYFMTHSLLCQEIKLDPSRKYALVDMASEMDFNKALALNGEEILDKPMKIAKAKVKSNNEKKVKRRRANKKVKDARCLFLKNVPYSATKEDIKKAFHKAVTVRFPGGANSPDKGIAFVEFPNRTIAKNMLRKKSSANIQGQDIIVDTVGKRKVPKDPADKKNTEAAPPSNILFVSNLPKNVNKSQLKKNFKKAVRIRIPYIKDISKRFAFVEFRTVKDAQKVLRSSKDIKICNIAAKIDMCCNKRRPQREKVSSKTLFVTGLAPKTTAESLKSAFEGAVGARVAVYKETRDSRRFGFVIFESEESCKAAKDTLEDRMIDGSKVTVDFALSKGERGQQGAGVGSAGPSEGAAAP